MQAFGDRPSRLPFCYFTSPGLCKGRSLAPPRAFSPDCRSNLMGTKFTVYDHGVNPMKAQGLVEKVHARQELAAVCYVSAVPTPCVPLGVSCCRW